MLNKMIIKDMVQQAVTFQRGQALFKSAAVWDLNLEENEGFEYVSAVVQGSGDNTYAVDITYDTATDSIDEVYCECPAFRSYEGICKHCVAVLLEMELRQRKQQAVAEYTQQRQAKLAQLMGLKGAATGKMQLRPMPTTPAFRELLTRRQLSRALPVIGRDSEEPIRLEPCLTMIGVGLTVSFKIGAGHMYVLKDVFGFAAEIHRRGYFEYGKKLGFVHTRDKFAEDSRKLVDFIINWCSSSRHLYQLGSSLKPQYEKPKVKDILLENGGDVEDFIGAVADRPFTAHFNYMAETVWQVTDQPFSRRLEIKAVDNGVWLQLEEKTGFTGREYYIYFEAGKVYRIPLRRWESIADFLSCLEELPERKAYLNREDIRAFCRELLPSLEKHFECIKSGFDEQDYGIIPAAFEIHLDSPQNDFITCRLTAVYDQQRYNVYDHNTAIGERDLAAEMAARKTIFPYFNAFDEQQQLMVLAGDEGKLYHLLTEGIPQMQELGEVYISETLKRVNVAAAPKVSVGVSLSGDLLQLSMTVDDMPREQLVDILSKYNRKKKYYRLSSGDFVNMADEGIQALLELQQGLSLTPAQLQREMVELPKYRALFLDSELKEAKVGRLIKDKAFKAMIRNMKTVEDNDFEIPQGMDKILREYQKKGFLWLKTLKANGFGGILADDMGLGKTLQVIALLASEYGSPEASARGPALIVSPASLVYNWYSEIQRFAPELAIRMVVGSSQERQQLIAEIEPNEIVLTSYDLLRRDLEYYQQHTFDSQVIDEAQYIKNQNTLAAKAVKAIKAGFKLALTGTPVENKLSELWSIFDYLMPGFFYSYPQFKRELEQPIVQEQDEQAVRRLQKMLRPFVLRRLKKDVLTDLPDKIEKNYYANLEGEQQKLYNAHVKRMQLMLDKQTDEEFSHGKIQILAELTRLRQLCCDPALIFADYHSESAKLQMCLELVGNAIGSGHKILLFSQFTTMLEKIQEKLAAAGISYYSLTGSVSKEKRAEMVERFNHDDTQVFCISLKAGGTGLNLTAADIVIHYDPWWNVAVQNQATDRAHRIGQEHVVTVYKLIVKGTIEEKIVALQEKKQELADEILSGEGMSVSRFSKEELLELLQ